MSSAEQTNTTAAYVQYSPERRTHLGRRAGGRSVGVEAGPTFVVCAPVGARTAPVSHFPVGGHYLCGLQAPLRRSCPQPHRPQH
eukprot:3994864-Prymnesium_polylepis.1